MTIRLTPTSYTVLGLLRWSPGSTAYWLERTIEATVSHAWAIQRSQIYREPGRLVEAGLLAAQIDDDGRQKTRYSVTQDGEEALDKWLTQPTNEMPQLRDLAILKLFFGADPQSIGRLRLLAHQSRLKEYELIRETGAVTLGGPLRVLEAAIAHERVSIRLWTELVKSSGDSS